LTLSPDASWYHRGKKLQKKIQNVKNDKKGEKTLKSVEKNFDPN